jgi:DNA repair protein RAD5
VADPRVLFGVHWERVVLDEAHLIKNASTEQARACCVLAARHRWCLTGTPVQNSLADVHSLLRFLRLSPWSDSGWWRRMVEAPYARGDPAPMRRLRDTLRAVLLRRTKATRDADGRPIVALPPRREVLVEVDLAPEERDFYEALQLHSQEEFRVRRGALRASPRVTPPARRVRAAPAPRSA